MHTSKDRAAERPPFIAPPPSSRIRLRRGRIECVVTGEGPALLALHGGMGGHDQSWLLARSLLTDPMACRIVALSRPGYPGTSQRLGHTPAQQADTCADLLDALGIGSVVVAAVSAGGPCALQFALRHPERCRGLILVSACSTRLPLSAAIERRLRLLRRLAWVPGLPTLMRRRAEKHAEETARRSILDPVQRAHTLNHPVAGPLLRSLQASVHDRLRQRLPGTMNDTAQLAALEPLPLNLVTAPTLVVHGTADQIVPFSHGQAVATAVPAAELMAIEGGEHVALFTHLDEVRTKVRRFLATHWPPA
ncbi:Alpha/beta hydrolase [Rhodovastum atsumiense]|uniref:Alpha/beta hydrolase n=1 Tax=Rhodovastum atsumiense TaxID=504468 RepID=A0A5M6IZW4_9PROT|nr:alpha/beta hydrolase [Rhodovastum atsumiense]KAA5613886.1 alpha/beta hydrolase [Rhodovastum atsumiense]CAH2602012.1 Alpha/beta hydrolase [Rhodovastum atsumiense]